MIISIYLANRLKDHKKFSKINPIILFWGILFSYLTFRQLFVGDGCIIDRTLKDYLVDHKKRPWPGLGEWWSREGQKLLDAVACAIDNQFGSYVYILIIAISLIVTGYKQDN